MLTWGLLEPGQRHLQALRVRVRPGGQHRDDRHQDRSSSATTPRPSRSGRSTRRRSAATRRGAELRLGADAEGQRRGDVQDPVDRRAGVDRLGSAAAGGLRRRAHRHRRRLPGLLEQRPRPAGTSSSTGRRSTNGAAHDRLADHRRLQPRRRRRQPVLQRHDRHEPDVARTACARRRRPPACMSATPASEPESDDADHRSRAATASCRRS